MRHLTSLKELSKSEILELLDLADNFIDSEGFIRRDPLFPDKKVVNIFCEPSTRTKISFEIAASNLGCQIIDFDLSSSSLEKGETLKDTIDNLAKMNINLCVLRHRDSVIHELIDQTNSMVFISGGEGSISHPSQGLLDIMTCLLYTSPSPRDVEESITSLQSSLGPHRVILESKLAIPSMKDWKTLE